MSSNSTIKNNSIPELFLQKFKTILLLAIFVFSSSTMFGQGTVNFTVDMNSLDVPNAEYDNVVINGSWNGWLGWGVTLADEDSNGVFAGSAVFDAGTSFEYVVAVTGPADSYGGWGMQFGEGCAATNFMVAVGDSGSVTESVADVSCTVAPVLATVDFSVDMNALDVPNSDYNSVVVNGSWNGWNGWGVTLADEDSNGVFTGSLDLDAGTSFEYVIAVTGPADSYGGWGMQFTACDGVNFTATAGEEGSITSSVAVVDCGVAPVPGCMDATACNHNIDATEDDGSCDYAAEGVDCDGNCLEGTASSMVMNSDSYWADGLYGASYTVSLDGEVVANGPSDSGEWLTLTDDLGCLVDGCYEVAVTTGDYGYTSDEYSLVFGGESFTLGSTGLASIGENGCVTGCTDEAAENFIADADISDNSLCEYAYVQGCMDESACNYDEFAEQEPVGACDYADAGFDCEGNCLEGVALTMTDDYTDGWNNAVLTINGDDYTLPYGSNYNVVCVPAADCYIISWTSGSWDSETSWTFNGQEGLDGSTPENMGVCVTGCTDEAAENFIADADISDNSLCEYAYVQGCMDESACNYDEFAEQEPVGACDYADAGFDCDGNCLEGTASSMVMNSDSYWADGLYGASYTVSLDGEVVANGPSDSGEWLTLTDDLGCLVDGCYEVAVTTGDYGYTSDEYSLVFGGESFTLGSTGLASIGENGCVTGCTDEAAENFIADADISDNSLCEYAYVQGCMDESACNYDEFAEQEPVGACDYADAGFDCEGNCLEGVALTMTDDYTDGWNNAVLTINGDDYTLPYGSNYNVVCVPAADCYIISWTSGSWDSETSWTFNGQEGLDGSTPENMGVCVTGCTDEAAENFIADADISDNSLCEYAYVQGCMDESACNYDEFAEQEPVGACDYAAEGVDCDGNCLEGTAMSMDMTSDQWQDGTYGASYTVSLDGEVVASGPEDTGLWATSSDDLGCLVDGCYEVAITEGAYNSSYPVTSYSWTFNDEVFAMNTSGSVYLGDGECEISGCTDALANNFDASANADDGTCSYCVDGEQVSELAEGVLPDAAIVVEVNTGDDAGEISWYIETPSGDVVMSGGNDGEGNFYQDQTQYISTSSSCVSDGCYKFVAIDSYGDGWNDDGNFNVRTQYGTPLITEQFITGSMGADNEDGDQEVSFIFSFGEASCAVYGCVDPAAANYNEEATDDDGTCHYCDEGADEFIFSFNQEFDVSDEVYVFNDTDTIFSVVSGDLSYYETASQITCAPEGCYTISMYEGDNGSDGWDDGSTLIITDGLFELNLVVGSEFTSGSVSYATWAVGNVTCENQWVPGCIDNTALNFDEAATYNDGTCSYLGDECETALIGVPSITEAVDYSFGNWVEVSADADGFGAVVSFEGTGGYGSSYTSWWIYSTSNCDSATILSNIDGYSDSLEAGQTLLFQAYDYYGYVESYDGSFGALVVNAIVQENPDTNLQMGCTDEAACNFNPEAESENWTCEYSEEGFDCDGEFNGSACGTDNPVIGSVAVPYGNNEELVFTYPSDGSTPVSILFTSGDTETGYDYWKIYDGVGDDVISNENLIVQFDDTLNGSFVSGNGNGITVVFDSDGSANGDESYGDMTFEVYCANIILGCTDATAVNYDENATVDNGLCTFDYVFGCTDATAINYNDEAVSDDGSCLQEGTLVTLPYFGTELTNCDNGNNLNADNTSYTSFYMSGDDALYMFSVADSGSVNIDLTSNTSYSGIIVFDGNPLLDESVVVVTSTSLSTDQSIVSMSVDTGITYYVVIDTWATPNCIDLFDLSIVQDIVGCMDVNADNFNSSATVSDYDLCVFEFVQGCTDENACNFDSAAEQNNGSCYYQGDQCDCPDVDVASVTDTIDYSFGNWVEVSADADGFGAVVSFEGTGGYGSAYTSWWIYSTSNCDSATILSNIDGYSDSLEAGQTLLFQAYDRYGYVESYDGSFGALVVSAIVVENPDTALIAGCTDEAACNFNPEAQAENFSCEYPEVGFDCEGACSNGGEVLAIYDSFGDGWGGNTLTINGEDFSLAFNGGFGSTGDSAYFCVTPADCYVMSWTSGSYAYETSWSFNGQEGSGGSAPENMGDCGVLGCTDELAPNYNEEATENDGSCEFYCASGSEVTLGGGSFLNETSYLITDCDGDSLFNGGGEAEELCLDLPENYIINLYDTYGDGWNGNVLAIGDDEYTIASGGDYAIFVIGDNCATLGCTDEDAFNFNADATIEDGSCIEVVYGCIDEDAENFDADANTADASCEYCDSENQFVLNMYDSWGDGWGFNASFTATTADGYSISTTLVSGEEGTDLICLPVGCYEVEVGGGNYDYEIDFSIDGLLELSPAGTYTVSVGNGCAVYGCTDDSAANFNGDATDEDGSCMYSTYFNVDMSCSDLEFVNVYVAGPFSGWSIADYNMMSDEDGDGIYSLDLWFAANETPEYKYLYTDANGAPILEDLVASGNESDNWSCIPVTDYWNYGNRQTSTGSVNDDTFESCYECGTIVGCTDPDAINYNPDANLDDDSCVSCELVTVNFSVNALDAVNDTADQVVINSSFAGPWYGYGVTLTDADGDGVYTGSAQVEAGITHEYVHALTGSGDGWSGWGTVGYAPESCALNDSTPNYFFSGECGDTIDLPTVCFGACIDCVIVEDVFGCTDPNADNFEPSANVDDESCTYCGEFEAVLISSSDATVSGSCDGSIQASGQGGSSNYSLVVYNADGAPQNPFGLCAGTYSAQVTDNGTSCTDVLTVTIGEPVVADGPCDIIPTGMFVDNIIHNRVVFNWSAPGAAPSHYMIRYRALGNETWTVMTAGPVNSNDYTGTSRTRYFMEPGTTYEWNIRARVLNEDGSMDCQSSWSAISEYTTLPQCANLENQSVSTEANWATFMADAPAQEWGVWQSKGKMRVIGTSSYRYVNGDSEGAINFLKGNFDAGTDYEWHTKAWCEGNVDSNGNSDPMYHSGWGEFTYFSTEDLCDAVPTNLTTSAANTANTAITMSWDTPESGAPDHYFVQLTDETTGQVWAWNAIAGDVNSQVKYGLTSGNDYSWKMRGACGTNGTSWATSYTAPVFYTLGAERLAGPVANLDVFPNPSRDIFNVSFESAEAQSMTVRVVNMIGEEVYTEELTEFVGSYNKVIDMNTQPKGVYFLEITTANGGINEKIVLQ